jgi:hypothetical protein
MKVVVGVSGYQIYDIETYCKYLDAVFKNTNLRDEASFPICLHLPLNPLKGKPPANFRLCVGKFPL